MRWGGRAGTERGEEEEREGRMRGRRGMRGMRGMRGSRRVEEREGWKSAEGGVWRSRVPYILPDASSLMQELE